MNQTVLADFSESVRKQLYEHILPFWSDAARDREQGGWLAWLDNDSKVDRTKPKGLILNSRILWTFSAVHRESPEKIYKEMAERAYEIITKHFWDSKNGGAFWQLTDDWKILDDSKKIYGQAFCIYALSEFYLAFGDSAARDRAVELFELIERHAHDSQNGGYFEVCRRDWSPAENASLSEKDMAEKKSMNNHLHVLEAFTNLYRVWKNERVENRLRELLDVFADKILDSRTNHLRHFFDERWNVRSDGYTFGHDIEAAWLLSEAAEVLDDAPLLQRIRAIASKIADTVLREGMDHDGGIFYEGRDGQIIDSGKEWWPQAEAVVGFLNAFQISGDETFFNAAKNVWQFILEHLVDRAHGDWFWRIDENGKPDLTRPKVSEWKCPYHNSRACLETLRRLKQIESVTK
ncbi:MAG TPA: AGE family epimerase/isomerase [Verrucomicrobiae bacterium]|nr:AGE family epimerase/isomerase [Verrucomicrobiae bacterium]